MNEESIKYLIESLKKPIDYFSLRRIPIVQDGEVAGFLRPIPVRCIGESLHDARLISEWRKKHKENFFAVYDPTETQTKDWLASSYASAWDDIFFMVENPARMPIGHLGFCNFVFSKRRCEIGRVNSSEFAPPGLMFAAAKASMAWAAQHLYVQEMVLSVFEENQRAVNFYSRLGFVTVRETRYGKTTVGLIERWQETATELREGKIVLEMAVALAQR